MWGKFVFPQDEKVFRCPIYKSNEYSKFKIMEGGINRKINQQHVKNLAISLKMKNFLRENPIKITDDFFVMDGQHRLKAAEEAGVDVYYLIDENTTMKDIIEGNAGTLKWNLMDFLEHYVAEGKQSYIFLKRMLEKYPDLKISTVLILIGMWNSKEWKKFKDGELALPDHWNEYQIDYLMQKINYILSFLSAHMLEFRHVVKTQIFHEALILFLKKEDIDPEQFIRKIQLCIRLIVPCTRVKHYHEIFDYIYNYKTANGKRSRRNKNGQKD